MVASALSTSGVGAKKKDCRGAYERKDDKRLACYRVFLSTPPVVRVEGVVLHRQKCFRHKDAQIKLTLTSQFLRWVYCALADWGWGLGHSDGRDLSALNSLLVP